MHTVYAVKKILFLIRKYINHKTMIDLIIHTIDHY